MARVAGDEKSPGPQVTGERVPVPWAADALPAQGPGHTPGSWLRPQGTPPCATPSILPPLRSWCLSEMCTGSSRTLQASRALVCRLPQPNTPGCPQAGQPAPGPPGLLPGPRPACLEEERGHE